jgi:hypothetical protein
MRSEPIILTLVLILLIFAMGIVVSIVGVVIE